MHACGISLYQRWRGESGSVLSRMKMKWFLNVGMYFSATFLLLFPGDNICLLMLLMFI